MEPGMNKENAAGEKSFRLRHVRATSLYAGDKRQSQNKEKRD
jgi:hypothetical protein